MQLFPKQMMIKFVYIRFSDLILDYDDVYILFLSWDLMFNPFFIFSSKYTFLFILD